MRHCLHHVVNAATVQGKALRPVRRGAIVVGGGLVVVEASVPPR